MDDEAVILECTPFLLEVLVTSVSLSYAGALNDCHCDCVDRKLAKQLAGDRIYIAILLWSISSKHRSDMFAFGFCLFRKLFLAPWDDNGRSFASLAGRASTLKQGVRFKNMRKQEAITGSIVRYTPCKRYI